MSFTASKRRKEEDSDVEDKENVGTKLIGEASLSPAVGCFDLKMHQKNSESHHHNSTLTKLLNLFRSKSDSSVKSGSKSDSTTKSSGVKSKSKTKTRSVSPSPTSAAPRRRFVRVVRDADAAAPEVVDDNPHVICRYSQSFLEDHYRKSQEELSNRPLPYVTSGHTILKKSSTDPTPSYEQHSPNTGKHATFKELVEIIEFSGQDVVESGTHVLHEGRLHDDEERASPEEGEKEPGFFLRQDSASFDADANDVDIADQEDETEPVSPQQEDDIEEGIQKFPAVDLDRMDGVMKNIFSSVANVHEASPEPPKIRRVEISELVNQCGLDEQT